MKKTGFMKVIGRNDYVVRHKVVRTSTAPNGELVSYLDFTFKK